MMNKTDLERIICKNAISQCMIDANNCRVENGRVSFGKSSWLDVSVISKFENDTQITILQLNGSIEDDEKLSKKKCFSKQMKQSICNSLNETSKVIHISNELSSNRIDLFNRDVDLCITNRNDKLLIVLLIILAIVLVGIVSYFVVKANKKKQKIDPNGSVPYNAMDSNQNLRSEDHVTGKEKCYTIVENIGKDSKENHELQKFDMSGPSHRDDYSVY